MRQRERGVCVSERSKGRQADRQTDRLPGIHSEGKMRQRKGEGEKRVRDNASKLCLTVHRQQWNKARSACL